MTRFVRRTIFWTALAGLAGAFPLGAQQGTDLNAIYGQAMAEFQSGDYTKAAAELEALVGRVEFSPQLEPIYYTIGSAYFNAANYSKAIAAFKTYQAKFPKGPHAGTAAFAIAQSNFLSKNYQVAAQQMAALENDPAMRDQALIFEAEAQKAAGKVDDAIKTLEKMVGTEIRTPGAMRGATLLAQLSAQQGNGAKALHVLELIHQKIDLVENLIALNGLTVQLGDKFYAKQQFKEALACYRFAYPREQIIRLQNERIAGMQKQIEDNLAAVRANPAEITQLAARNNEIKGNIADAQKVLADFERLPTITPAIYLRLARCFYELDRKWESIVVDQEILDRFPKNPEYEPALFSLIVSLADVGQAQRAEERCQEYLRDFKNGPNAATVGYLLGAVALQAGNPQAAETYFGRILQDRPNSRFREQIRYLLANAKFSEGNYPEAVAAYQKYLAEFPKGTNTEDVHYRIALCALFAGKYEDALKQLQDYAKNHPNGAFLADAKYRIAVCLYAAAQYDEVIADCQSWEKKFSGNSQLGEVLALLADAYAASNREAAAIPVYIRSYQTAATDEVMNYSLTAASKLLQKQGDWDKVAALYTDFINDKPNNPTVVTALYWIGKAKAHEGKIDEAKQLAADTIKKYIDDPAREAVDQLITQLAQLCVKKAKPAEAGATPAPASDPGAELERLLARSGGNDSPTPQARILFAKAELARLRRQPDEEKNQIAEIAKAKPEELSPQLLGEVGDYLVARNNLDGAARFYQQLLEAYPKSAMIDYAYNGLGEIACQKKELQKALGFFNDGLDKIGASQKLKEITVGRAKTLLALGRLDEAQKGFEQVVSVREWRGESTAFAVYSLGEIAAKRDKWAEANAYFQRVYVGYQKFLPWVAKAYIGSGTSFEKLGKTQEAVNTYREMLRNQKMAGFAETGEARKRLEALGQGS